MMAVMIGMIAIIAAVVYIFFIRRSFLSLLNVDIVAKMIAVTDKIILSHKDNI